MWLSLGFYIVYSLARISAQDIPKWPSAYSVRGTIQVPYAELAEPFCAWYDASAGSSRVDYYNGTVKTYQLSKAGKYGTYYKMEPVLTAVKCFKIEGTAEKKVYAQSVLPDMTGFKFKGQAEIKGVKAEKWERVSMSDTVFTMYLYWKKQDSTKVIIPLRYEQLGMDHHYTDFEDFSADPPPPAVFKIENVGSCKPLKTSEVIGIENQLVYSFNPIQEYIEHVTNHVDLAWKNYKLEYNKKYPKDEDIQRKNIFRQQMRFITSRNRANLSYTLGVSTLTDYTPEEIKVLTSCSFSSGFFGNEEFYQEAENETLEDISLPKSFDWRNRGAVTPVKYQGNCGSCWSFSATGAIEGAYFIKTKRLVSLSEQVLIDCTWNYGNRGCNGGLMEGAFKWVIRNKGIPVARAYGPYRAAQNYCRVNKKMANVKISRYGRPKALCSKCIKNALIKFGPIAIGMHANNAFNNYRGGFFNDNSCPKSPNQMNHAMLIVGYGKLRGQEYWLVKNSWGNGWGSGGYALMGMHANICGVMGTPLFVVA